MAREQYLPTELDMRLCALIDGVNDAGTRVTEWHLSANVNDLRTLTVTMYVTNKEVAALVDGPNEKKEE